MLKKFGIGLLALLLVGGVMISCNEAVDLAPLSLNDNYLYGNGYQGKMNAASVIGALTDGAEIKDGNEYEFTIVFSVVGTQWVSPRDGDLQIGLVCEDPGCGYWKRLSFDPDSDDSEGWALVKAADIVAAGGNNVEATFTLVVDSDDEAEHIAAATLAFQFESSIGTQGVSGSGSSGLRSLDFSVFEVTLK